jgi:hypothetical protein
MKKKTIPVTKDFRTDLDGRIGFMTFKEGVTINQDYCFEPGFEIDKNGKLILKEISLVRKNYELRKK